MDFKKEDLVKSPLNYTGGKFKLLPQILPLFPDKINTFVDLFAGGCNVGANINANTIVCNDIEATVIDFMYSLKKCGTEKALKIVKDTVSKYNLSKTNEEGFKRIREDYNKGDREWDMFYSMVTNAFNYQIRFNKNKEYNMPFGRDRSSFNPTLEKNFVKFSDKISKLNIHFSNEDFRALNLKMLSEEDFVYCDCPYLITTASYNESGGWTEKDEKDLLNMLDELNCRGVKFALSNVLESKGKENVILKEWSKDYTIHYLNKDYSNCNYQIKDKKSKDIEVLITNY